MKEEKAQQLKKNVGTFIVHDVMEEKILWNNSMSKGSSVRTTSSYLDFVSVYYNSIVSYNNCISQFNGQLKTKQTKKKDNKHTLENSVPGKF